MVDQAKRLQEAADVIRKVVVSQAASALESDGSTLTSSDIALLSEELPILQAASYVQAKRLMEVIRELVISDTLPESFSRSPREYLIAREAIPASSREIAPAVFIDVDAVGRNVQDLRAIYHSGRDVDFGEHMAVHSSTQSKVYTQTETRTTYTYSTSTSLKTETRSIISSESNTKTVTSGRGYLEHELPLILINPDILDQRIIDFRVSHPGRSPLLEDVLDPMATQIREDHK